jgi:hypothetical protein
MLNLPGETLDDLDHAIDFYTSERPDAIKVYWLTPLPGSHWFTEVAEKQLLPREAVEGLRRGRAFGNHSYLFVQDGFTSPAWLGSHFVLAFLPHLPRWAVRAIRALRVHRWFRIRSFLLLVGLSRLPFLLSRQDRVGEGHLLRLVHALIRWSH